MATETAKLNLDPRLFLKGIRDAIRGNDQLKKSLGETGDAAEKTEKDLGKVGAGAGKSSLGVAALAGGVAGLAAELAGSLAENIKAAVGRMGELGGANSQVAHKMQELRNVGDAVLKALIPAFNRVLDVTLNVVDGVKALVSRFETVGTSGAREALEGLGVKLDELTPLFDSVKRYVTQLYGVLSDLALIVGSVYLEIEKLVLKALGPLLTKLAQVAKFGFDLLGDALGSVREKTQAFIQGNETLRENQETLNKVTAAATGLVADLGRKRTSTAKSTEQLKEAQDKYVASLFAALDAEIAQGEELARVGQLMRESLKPTDELAKGFRRLSDEASGLLPPLEGLDGEMGQVDDSGAKTAQRLSTLKDVVKRVAQEVRDLTVAATELGLQLGSGALAAGVSVLDLDLAGLLDMFAEGIPAALGRLEDFGKRVGGYLQEALGELPGWVAKAGAAAGAALNFVGKTAGAAVNLVAGVVGAVDGLLQRFGGVSIAGLIFGDAGDVRAVFAEAGAGLRSFIDSIPRLIAEIFQSGALGDLFATALNGLVGALPRILPAVVGFLRQAATDLVKSLPAILQAVIKSDLGRLVKDVLVTLAAQLPVLIPQLIEIGAQIMVGVVEALPTLVVALIKALPAIAAGLAKAIFDVLRGLLVGVLRALGLDKKADKVAASYGDTPGIVSARPGFQTFRFAPGDVVAAARNADDLQRMINVNVGQDSVVSELQQLRASLENLPGSLADLMGTPSRGGLTLNMRPI